MINTVMIVEDESFFSDILKDALYLEDFNAQTIIFNSADEAEIYYKKVLKTNKPDCLLLDINLIGSSFDGIEFARKVKDDYGNEIVIGMISGSDDDVDINKCKEVGAQFYIVKTEDISPRIKELKSDYEKFKNKTLPFKIYK